MHTIVSFNTQLLCAWTAMLLYLLEGCAVGAGKLTGEMLRLNGSYSSRNSDRCWIFILRVQFNNQSHHCVKMK